MEYSFFAVEQILNLHQTHETTVVVLDVLFPIRFLTEELGELGERNVLFVVNDLLSGQLVLFFDVLDQLVKILDEVRDFHLMKWFAGNSEKSIVPIERSNVDVFILEIFQVGLNIELVGCILALLNVGAAL